MVAIVAVVEDALPIKEVVQLQEVEDVAEDVVVEEVVDVVVP